MALKTGFVGTYQHNLDAKNRVSMPAKIKKYIEEMEQDPERGSSIILIKSHDRSGNECLEGFMVSDWERMVGKVQQEMNFVRKEEDMDLDEVAEKADTVQIDNSGRIMINPMLKAHAKISRGVVFTGSIDRFRVWSAEKYAEKNNGRQ
ncbi:MAG: hypothetical protein LLG37_08200 [Spirochaetia bacterium]|nr:hypothetical protein [Spirochaetia bacterium]